MGSLQHYFNGSYWLQLFLFAVIAMISFFVFSIIGIGFAMVLYGFNPIDSLNLTSQMKDPNVVNGLRLVQLFNSMGIFVAPPLIFGWLKAKNPVHYFKLNRAPHPDKALLAFLIIVAALPVINLLAQWNASLHLPEAFSELEAWMRSTEKSAEQLVEALLKMESTNTLLFNLLVIAVIPAVGEELFFRGGLQPLIQKGLKNRHAAIWITAFLFSALHGQFLGFIPRLLLGALLGYLFVWSKNLWLPIIAHFANNGIAVLVAFYIQKGELDEQIETVGTNEGDLTFALGGAVLMAFLLFSFYRSYQQKKPPKNSEGSSIENQN